ncbi:hypothetical protein [Microcoleus sp.]
MLNSTVLLQHHTNQEGDHRQGGVPSNGGEAEQERPFGALLHRNVGR